MAWPSPSLYPSASLYPGPPGPFAAQVLASFQPWLAHDPEGALQNVLQAYAAMGEQVFDIVQDTGSPDVPASFTAGWSVLLDPTNCPAQFIPFGAQFVGVQIPSGMDAADARALWKNEAGFARGTPAAIIAAAQRFLTGSQSVVLQERTGTGLLAYSFVLIVRPEQVTNVTQLQAAVDSVRPAGITWTLIQTDGWIISQMEASQTTIAALEANFVTLNGLENDQPGT